MGTRWTDTTTTAIAIQVPARLDQLVMIRALAETLCLIADFAIDEVTDIRLALDEVVTALTLDAAPDTTLDLSFTYRTAGEARMCVRARSVSATDSLSAHAGLGWHIVRTLTDTVTATHGSFDPGAGGYPTVVEFDWVRAGTL